MIESTAAVRVAPAGAATDDACIDLWAAAVAARDGGPETPAVRARAAGKFAAERVALVVAPGDDDLGVGGADGRRLPQPARGAPVRAGERSRPFAPARGGRRCPGRRVRALHAARARGQRAGRAPLPQCGIPPGGRAVPARPQRPPDTDVRGLTTAAGPRPGRISAGRISADRSAAPASSHRGTPPARRRRTGRSPDAGPTGRRGPGSTGVPR
jgi:hypothetical protein